MKSKGSKQDSHIKFKVKSESYLPNAKLENIDNIKLKQWRQHVNNACCVKDKHTALALKLLFQ